MPRWSTYGEATQFGRMKSKPLFDKTESLRQTADDARPDSNPMFKLSLDSASSALWWG
jgi:hypothetical protein